MGEIINTAAGHTPTPVLRGVFCQILSPPELTVARTRENTVRLPPNPTHKKASEKPKGFKDGTRVSCPVLAVLLTLTPCGQRVLDLSALGQAQLSRAALMGLQAACTAPAVQRHL